MQINGYEWRRKKVLVTGASGFKGAWLCKALHGLGAEVYGTVRSDLHPASAYSLLSCQQYIVASQTDITDRQQVYDLVNGITPDVIFHLAAKALVPVGLRDPRRTYDVNIMGTINLIEACRRVRVCDRMLICSTDHVFGNVELDELPVRGFDEHMRVSYGGPYDTSKAAMELLVRSYHSTFWSEVPAIGITRCANVFGLGDTNQRRVIPYFISSAKKTGVVDLIYRQNGRQFIYVTDAIAGYVKAASSLDEGGFREKLTATKPDARSPFTPTFHFAIQDYDDTQSPYIRMLSVANVTAGLFGARVSPGVADYAPNENKVQALDCDVTRKQLAWNPQVTFVEGLAKLGQWLDAEGMKSEMASLVDADAERIVRSIVD